YRQGRDQPCQGRRRHKALAAPKGHTGTQLGEHLVLEVNRVDVVPAMLEADSHADVDERQVVVERVLENRLKGPVGGHATGDEEEPSETGGAKVAAPHGDHRSASGTGFLGSGPMYSDCGRMRRLLEACSRT